MTPGHDLLQHRFQRPALFGLGPETLGIAEMIVHAVHGVEPAGAGVEGLPESRQLQILIDVFNNRLNDAMRERAGASYSPQINVSWPTDLDSGGMLTAISQVAPDDVPVFFRVANEIANG